MKTFTYHGQASPPATVTAGSNKNIVEQFFILIGRRLEGILML